MSDNSTPDSPAPDASTAQPTPEPAQRRRAGSGAAAEPAPSVPRPRRRRRDRRCARLPAHADARLRRPAPAYRRPGLRRRPPTSGYGAAPPGVRRSARVRRRTGVRRAPIRRAGLWRRSRVRRLRRAAEDEHARDRLARRVDRRARLVPFIGSIVGVITGHMSLSQIKRNGEGGRGMASPARSSAGSASGCACSASSLLLAFIPFFIAIDMRTST